jgi:hypothetical protein
LLPFFKTVTMLLLHLLLLAIVEAVCPSSSSSPEENNEQIVSEIIEVYLIYIYIYILKKYNFQDVLVPLKPQYVQWNREYLRARHTDVSI